MPNIESFLLDTLDIDPLNARFNARTSPTDPSVILLAQSMKEVGQLQPIVIRASTETAGRYYVTVGWRRCLAARHLAWSHIDAIEFDDSLARVSASSAAENIARLAMHPVDTWQSIARLCDEHGYSQELAAAAIGLDPLTAPRMRYLAQMAPAMLDELRRSPAFPTMPQLRLLASASHATQQIALDNRGSTEPIIHWERIAAACKTTRISRSRAIFDIEKADIAWEEDLLAQADDADRFTTQDLRGFLAAQREALAEQVKKSRGRIAIMQMTAGGGFVLPDGWQRVWGDIPKRWAKDDPRCVFKTVVDTGSDLGEVVAILAAPVVKRTPAATLADGSKPAPKPPIQKATQRRIAEKQTEGVVNALPYFLQGDGERGVRALLAVLLFSNVTIQGGMYDLIPQLRAVFADPPPDDDVLLDLVREVVKRALVFPAPDVFNHSGPAANAFAHMVGAAVPRCDTPEILKGVMLEELRRIALDHGLSSHGTATDLRKRLAGQAHKWRPATYDRNPFPQSSALIAEAIAEAEADIEAQQSEAAE
jgi:ParB/RepB/Spo0J family partition protein